MEHKKHPLMFGHTMPRRYPDVSNVITPIIQNG